MSAEEFFRFCQDNPQLRLERDAKGEIIFMSPSGSNTSRIIFVLATRLGMWNIEHEAGHFHESSAGFTLPDGSVRAADLAFVSHLRMEGIATEAYDKFAPVCPNFIVEVISPSDSLTEQQAKMDEWMQNGVELGWLIDPKTEQVWIYESNKETVHHSGFDRSLSGVPVLAGFTFDLKLLRG
ncbi:MAG TPA: hypothetical protein DCR93_17530 [Cytophagales bacterium]|nr:hypothetical protein [Cytophagales bacterium]